MKKLVIIGGGFAGSYIAKKLEKRFDVTLIDTKDYFEFTPGVLRAVVEPRHLRKIQKLHSHYLHRSRIVVGEVQKVDSEAVYVKQRKFAYDYLVISSGSRYELPFKEQNLVVASRGEHLRNVHSELEKARSVILVGGGLVAVELAGEILDHYRGQKEITIVHSGERLIERNHDLSIAYAEKYLQERGVEVLYEERVKDVVNCSCVTEKGTEIKADMVFLCTGIKPNFEFLPSEWLAGRGVSVDEHLMVRGTKNVFAAGDVTSIEEEKTAQTAEKQAEVVIENILNLENKKDFTKYVSKKRPMLISLGKNAAIYDDGKRVFSGWLVSWLKWGVERVEMMKKL